MSTSRETRRVAWREWAPLEQHPALELCEAEGATIEPAWWTVPIVFVQQPVTGLSPAAKLALTLAGYTCDPLGSWSWLGAEEPS